MSKEDNNTSAFLREVKESGEERLWKLTEGDTMAVLVSHQLLPSGASAWQAQEYTQPSEMMSANPSFTHL